jgi:3-dehydroquinate synthetase
MCMAAEMSTEMTLTERSVLERTVALMARAGLPTTIANNVHARAEYDDGEAAYDAVAKTLTTDKFLDYMSMDKKVSDGQLSLVLLQGGTIGNSLVTNKFDEPTLRSVVARYTGQL